MAIQKQNLNINFAEGLDTKTDPFQVRPGRFLSLKNSIFGKGGLLQKRNGYQALTPLSDATSKFITTFNGDLTVIGNKLQAYAQGPGVWANKGYISPADVTVMPLIRNNTNQSQVDTAVSNGMVCTVYTDQDPTSLATAQYKYAVADSTTGQNIIAPTVITSADADFGTPRVFALGHYFVIIFTNKVSSTYHLKYFTIGTASLAVTAPVDISTSYTPRSRVSFDAAILNNTLYIAWNGAAASGIKMTYLTATLNLGATFNPDPAHVATFVGVTADLVRSVIWVSYYDQVSNFGYTFAVDAQISSIASPTQIISSATPNVLNITGSAQSGVLTIFYEVLKNYSYDSSIPTHFIQSITATQPATAGNPATIGSAVTVLRSVGLASKSFILGGAIYFLCVYDSPYQPTYFLSDSTGKILGKLAYGNAGGYLSLGLPSVTVTGSLLHVGYRIKDLIQAVNKDTNVASGTQVNGIYSQTGLNLASILIGSEIICAEIGNNLNISGGFLWSYDGYSPVEQGFFLWPDSVETTPSASGGSMSAQVYFYQVTYEWTDNQGGAFRSAPSIPVKATTTTGSSSVTLNIPTLRLTYKTANPVKIVIYRWSAAQETYYQVSSLTTPILNDLTIDSIAFVDTLADATILGNNIIYTNGGTVENIGGPACRSTFIFDDRLWLVASEDDNLWFSKQVIPGAPVELSDLLTKFVPPNTGAQGPSGKVICGFPMDSNAILFKASSLLYFGGTGPDNTGANNQYSPPALITATVGCTNQNSIVFTPNGLMFEFQSEAGNQIWLLGRDLSTKYIGAAVESLTKDASVESAVNIPGTNQVRFTLSSGVTLMYDYFYGQWGEFEGVPAISSAVYQGLHAFLDSFGRVFLETPGKYVDGANPVLMSFTTSWLNMAGLQGYQRAYYFFLVGVYISPHKLSIGIAYDYNPSITQGFTIGPDNFTGVYGSDPFWGVTPDNQDNLYGGNPTLEQWRCFFEKQKCESFQITLTELFDASFGTVPGAGLTLSGLDIVYGMKKGWPRVPASRQIG